VLITIGESFGLGRGELTTLLGAAAFGVHVAYLARIAPRHVLVPLTAVQLIVTASLGFVLSWFLEGPTLPTGPELPAVIGTGLAVSAGALLLQVWAQTRVGSTRTASILALVPLVGLLAGVVFLGERPLVEGWLGAVVIVAALQLVIVRNAEPETLVAQAVTAAH
jgi:drug/metabolite transporter (DMT)-like permease